MTISIFMTAFSMRVSVQRERERDGEKDPCIVLCRTFHILMTKDLSC